MNKTLASFISHIAAILCSGVVLTSILLLLVNASITEAEKTRYDGLALGLWMMFAFGCTLFISFPLTTSVQYLKNRYQGKWWMAPIIIALLGFAICSSMGSGIVTNRFILLYGIVNFLTYLLTLVNLKRWLARLR